MRKMCHVELIEEIRPIENSDNLAHYRVEGWWVVGRKDKYKVGDKILYIEIDSICPRIPYFDFLDRNGSGSERNWKIRTIKLRGAMSQGLIIPYDDRNVIFQQLIQKKSGVEVPIERIGFAKQDFQVGDDLTDKLEIKKWEPMVECCQAGQVHGTFPHFLKKTDEPRIQGKEGRTLFEELQGQPFYITVKLDGTSGTFYLKDDHFGVCSRNNEYRYNSTKPNYYWYAAMKHEVEVWLRRVKADSGCDFCIQGEVCGPRIQENKLGLLEPTLFVFNMYNITKDRFLSWEEMKTHVETYPTKFTLVPLFCAGLTFDFKVEDLFEMADGFYDGTQNLREGLVIRHAQNKQSEQILGERISFKVISNKFLLKEK